MSHIGPNGILRATLGLLAAFGLGCGAEATRPDVLLVTWDTVRADHVGSHGGESATPHLDELAREGVAFSEARSPVPITLPAHATLLTGLFPATHGVRDNGLFRLAAAVPTLPERLAAEGYATGAFVSARVLERDAGLERGFEVYDDRVEAHPFLDVVAARRGDRTVDAALRWLESVPRTRPVFLWVHLYDPHRSWEAPEPWSRRFDPYRAEIAFTDDQTGRLLAGVEATGRLSRAIVAITSDHGESLGEHGEATHAYFAYDSTLRVPLVWWAGSEVGAAWARGAAVPGPASLADLVPTLVALLGLDAQPTEGRSLVASLEEGRAVSPRTLPLETVAPAYAYGTAPVFGLLTEAGETWFDLPRRERYDLARDPAQRDNLYAASDAARADALFAASPRAWPPGTSAQEVDRETRAALDALGYVSGASLPPADAAPVDPKDRVELLNFLTVDSELLTPEQGLEASAALQARHGALPSLARFRARTFDAVGRSRDAIEAIEAGLREHPNHTLLVEDLARRRAERAQQEALAGAIRATLARQPDHPRARHDLALTLHRLQAFDEAEALYGAILADDAGDDAARLNLASLLMAQGRAEEALARVDAGRERPEYDASLDCAAGRILAFSLDLRERAVAPLRACAESGAHITPLDRSVLADARP